MPKPETEVYRSKAIEGGERVSVPCAHCGKMQDINKDEYETNTADGSKPLCMVCGWTAYFNRDVVEVSQ